MPHDTCRGCGGRLYTNQWAWCSAECQLRSECVLCGALFQRTRPQSRRTTCSDNCKAALVDARRIVIGWKRRAHRMALLPTCPECGDRCPSTRATYCGKACQMRAYTDRVKTDGRRAKWSATYRERHADERAEQNRRWKAENPDAVRASWDRRRARKRDAFVADVDRAEVFERDSWICQLCADPVDPDLAYPDPMSASLDHVVPLARGGTHEPSNCQLAHLTCNVSKGDRVASAA